MSGSVDVSYLESPHYLKLHVMYLSHGLAYYNCFIFCMWPTIIMYCLLDKRSPTCIFFWDSSLSGERCNQGSKGPLKVNVTLKFFLETVGQVGKKKIGKWFLT